MDSERDPLDEVEKILDFYEVTEPRRGQLLALAVEANQRAVPTPPGLIEQRVQVRMARQKVLTSREPPLDFSVVLDEAVILRKTGDNDLMYRQLHHLVEVADLPNVDLRILPLASGSNPINDSFIVFSFGAPQPFGAPPPDVGATMLHDVVWVESVKSQFYIEDEKDTYNFSLVFKGLQEAALPQADSKRFITETARRVWGRP